MPYARFIAVAAAFAVGAGLSSGIDLITRSHAITPQKIQYAVVRVTNQSGPASLQEPLDYWGNEGWELVQYEPTISAIILKRVAN
jgi:hypothetical protein